MRRKFGKLMLIAVVVVLFVALSTAGFASDGVRYEDHAEVLKSLGLFSGTNNGFELDRAPKRVEVAAMLVKFLGAEDEAIKMKYIHPFTDVPKWADHLIGYMYKKGLTTGIGNNMFGSSRTASARDYTVFLLKALGYDMNDFEYANTMAFAVKSGIFSASDRAEVESRAFRRDEMVYLSYNALFAKTKGTQMTLAAKLGKGEVPKVVMIPEATITIRRELEANSKTSVKYIIDKKQLPAEYSDFTYLGVASVYWNFETTNEVINALYPELTGGSDLAPYSPDDGFTLGKNSIAVLYDSKQNIIGYFDIMNNNGTGAIQVRLKPVKPIDWSNLSMTKVTAGVSANLNGELVVNRAVLPSPVKNYAKIAVADYAVSKINDILFQSKSAEASVLAKQYTTDVIDVIGNTKQISSQLNVYFLDGSNKAIGYALVDTKPLVEAMKKKLAEMNIVEIKKGVVVPSATNAGINPYLIKREVDYPNPEALVYWSTATNNPIYPAVSLAYGIRNNTNKNLQPVTLGGLAVNLGSGVTDDLVVFFFNKDSKLIAYSNVPNAMFGTRSDVFKTIEVYISGDTSFLSNGDYVVEYYKDGKLMGTRQSESIEVIHENSKVVGVKLPNMPVDPYENYEIKVRSTNSRIKVESFLVK